MRFACWITKATDTHSELFLHGDSGFAMAPECYVDTYSTRCFIMYSGITKIYYRKPVGHVFTKPVQVEGTNQTFFSPSKLFFIVVHISAARRCECM